MMGVGPQIHLLALRQAFFDPIAAYYRQIQTQFLQRGLQLQAVGRSAMLIHHHMRHALIEHQRQFGPGKFGLSGRPTQSIRKSKATSVQAQVTPRTSSCSVSKGE